MGAAQVVRVRMSQGVPLCLAQLQAHCRTAELISKAWDTSLKTYLRKQKALGERKCHSHEQQGQKIRERRCSQAPEQIFLCSPWTFWKKSQWSR